jgi:hypothetical protein
MVEEKFVVSWGIVVEAKDFEDAERKAKAKLQELIGKDAFKKLDEVTDELSVGEAHEDEPEE